MWFNPVGSQACPPGNSLSFPEVQTALAAPYPNTQWTGPCPPTLVGMGPSTGAQGQPLRLFCSHPVISCFPLSSASSPTSSPNSHSSAGDLKGNKSHFSHTVRQHPTTCSPSCPRKRLQGPSRCLADLRSASSPHGRWAGAAQSCRGGRCLTGKLAGQGWGLRKMLRASR